MDLSEHIAKLTHGDPPNRSSLTGSDEKWAGYLLGVEEATRAAESSYPPGGVVSPDLSERDPMVKRPVPTLIHDGKAWVEAEHYDQWRDRALAAEKERTDLRSGVVSPDLSERTLTRAVNQVEGAIVSRQHGRISYVEAWRVIVDAVNRVHPASGVVEP